MYGEEAITVMRKLIWVVRGKKKSFLRSWEVMEDCY